MIKRFLIGVILTGITGCAAMSGSDIVTRVVAALGCVTALTNAGVQIAGDPALNGAVTAVGVLEAIMRVGASNIPGAVMTACAETLDYAKEDATGALAMAKATPPAKGDKVQIKPPAGARAQQPLVPTRVQIPVK